MAKTTLVIYTPSVVFIYTHSVLFIYARSVSVTDWMVRREHHPFLEHTLGSLGRQVSCALHHLHSGHKLLELASKLTAH